MPRRDAEPLAWRAIFDDHRRSGLTQAEFCRRRGISLHSFRKRRYARPAPDSRGAEPAAPAERPRLVPVTLVADVSAPEVPADAADPLVLILDGRRRIAVAPGFDPATLRRLLDALEGRP
jgi:hypothetical protein